MVKKAPRGYSYLEEFKDAFRSTGAYSRMKDGGTPDSYIFSVDVVRMANSPSFRDPKIFRLFPVQDAYKMWLESSDHYARAVKKVAPEYLALQIQDEVSK